MLKISMAADQLVCMSVKENPFEKLSCLVDCCFHANAATSGKNGADELLPTMIYVILQVNIIILWFILAEKFILNFCVIHFYYQRNEDEAIGTEFLPSISPLSSFFVVYVVLNFSFFSFLFLRLFVRFCVCLFIIIFMQGKAAKLYSNVMYLQSFMEINEKVIQSQRFSQAIPVMFGGLMDNCFTQVLCALTAINNMEGDEGDGIITFGNGHLRMQAKVYFFSIRLCCNAFINFTQCILK